MTPSLDADTAAFIEIRSTCTYRSRRIPEHRTEHQCFHPGLPRMEPCCQTLCPILCIRKASLPPENNSQPS